MGATVALPYGECARAWALAREGVRARSGARARGGVRARALAREGSGRKKMIEAKHLVVWTETKTKRIEVEEKAEWTTRDHSWSDPIGANYRQWCEMTDEQRVHLMLETAIDLAMNGFDLGDVLKAFSQVRQFRALGGQSFPMCRAFTKALLGRSFEPNTMGFEDLLIHYRPVGVHP